MKIARFLIDGEESFGVLNGDSLLDIKAVARLCSYAIPGRIENLMSATSRPEEILKSLVEKFSYLSENEKERSTLRLNEVVLKAPISSPPKIICLGLNYRDHAEESGSPVPEEPIIFMKPRTCIIGPEEYIVKPRFVSKLDYEVELAVIIGKRGKDIPVSEASKYIFGYTVFNDVSARDIQFKDGQWTRGKSFDTFAPIGPFIVTSDQIGDPNNLQMYTRVNDEVRQCSSTKNMIFNVYEVVHHLSRVMTLEPCDIIATGTPAGVGAFMKPYPKFLKPGDVVEAEIEKIGILRNYVTEA
ncbi:MAG: fumarylacetoacetate hydrolase family protein [Nitrososphaerota archaeon]|nr:fumarylacetoacetate hydrolase family protein [Candidatus Bathyarchaeota archaeon]MDW8048719.1 fumarylacetoacetate hydrolase family protein [Nitrososphaerota archaeon]